MGLEKRLKEATRNCHKKSPARNGKSESVCGKWAFVQESQNRYSKMFCMSPRCKNPECQKARHKARVKLISALVSENALDRFFTLTLDPKTCGTVKEAWSGISAVWARLIRVVRKAYPGIKYVAILEKHKQNDRPHIHGFWDRFIPVCWLAAKWVMCGGGQQVKLEALDVSDTVRIGEYVSKQLTVAKYVGKDCQNIAKYVERGQRTIWRSIGLKAQFELDKTKPKSDDEKWTVVKSKVFDGNVLDIPYLGEYTLRRSLWYGQEQMDRASKALHPESLCGGWKDLGEAESSQGRSCEVEDVEIETRRYSTRNKDNKGEIAW